MRRSSSSGSAPPGRLWIDVYSERALAVCVDRRGWLVVSVEVSMKGLSRHRQMRRVSEAIQGLVERLPEEFKESAKSRGFELRGVQPFLRLRKGLETRTGYRIMLEAAGGLR